MYRGFDIMDLDKIPNGAMVGAVRVVPDNAVSATVRVSWPCADDNITVLISPSSIPTSILCQQLTRKILDEMKAKLIKNGIGS